MSIHSETTSLLREMELVYKSISSYHPVNTKPPILDSSEDVVPDQDRDSQNIYGLRPFLETVKRDIDVVEQFLADPDAAFLPPPSTNAPYLIAVWKEVLSSPPPVIAIGKPFYERSRLRTDGEGKKQARAQSSGKSTGVKVDVVANNGHTWIRVNTAKNSRLLAEFREIDSYLTDSDDEGATSANAVCLPPAQREFDNSLLRTGRALLDAARANPVLGTNAPPEVIFCLPRIDPDAQNENGNDPRIALTVESLRDMGLTIKLGERSAIEQLVGTIPALPSPPTFIPTHQINLDLSILIALVSDLTHAPLPESVDAAHERFIPSAAYVEWKRSRLRAKSGGISDNMNAAKEDADDSLDSTQHSRALAGQLQQEMHKGILQEIYERLLASRRQFSAGDHTDDPVPPLPPLVEFWTTAEARDRCLRIVAKIGGPAERQRACALFPTSPVPVNGVEPSSTSSTAAEQEAQYWADSRYPPGFLPLLPIRVFPTPESAQSPDLSPRAGFFNALEATCRALLATGGTTHPRALASPEVEGEGEGDTSEVQRASVVRTNVRLTTHTVQSMLCGAARGWTTLTANRASVKAVLREMKMRGYGVDAGALALARDRGADAVGHAALWIVDPRSLAEGMRSDLVD
ncbi:hypothetical protein BC827DRAFT_1368250 [Russula dissimulans]|nr:hypothetical protein BC827DRAFT_1368250 [Russula dissimulans]